jgi:hypothetical protein
MCTWRVCYDWRRRCRSETHSTPDDECGLLCPEDHHQGMIPAGKDILLPRYSASRYSCRSSNYALSRTRLIRSRSIIGGRTDQPNRGNTVTHKQGATSITPLKVRYIYKADSLFGREHSRPCSISEACIGLHTAVAR